MRTGNKIQTQIMATVFTSLFAFAVLLLLIYEYELYNTSVRSARALTQIIDSRYLTRINRILQTSSAEQSVFEELAYEIQSNSLQEGSKERLQRYAKQLSLDEFNIVVDSNWYSSESSPSLSNSQLAYFLKEPNQNSGYYDKERDTFIVYYPILSGDGRLIANSLGIMSMTPIKSGLAEYRHVLIENGYQDASVFLKSADFFMGENLKFGHYYLLRNRSEDLLFELTESGFLTMHPFSLPGGTTGYMGCIIPENEVLKEVYRLGYISALTVFGLFCILILFTYFNLRRILYPLQQAMHKVEDSSRDIERIASASSKVSSDLILAVKEQGSTIEQTGIIMQEVSGLSNSAYQKSSQMKEKVGFTENLVNEGSRRIESLSENMTSLNEFANEMTGIVSLIKEIANRIDIVAINAAIEAARAGDKGRDFAVVADEIARLANNSLENSLRIEKQIYQSMNLINNGLLASRDTHNMLSKINDQIAQTVESVDEIANQVQEQNSAIMELNKAILVIERHNQKNRLAADFTSDQGRELNQAVRSLHEVGQMIYRLVGEMGHSESENKESNESSLNSNELSKQRTNL